MAAIVGCCECLIFRMVEEEGTAPSSLSYQDSVLLLNYSSIMEGSMRIELIYVCLKGRCSTNEPRAHFVLFVYLRLVLVVKVRFVVVFRMVVRPPPLMAAMRSFTSLTRLLNILIILIIQYQFSIVNKKDPLRDKVLVARWPDIP